MSTTGQQSAGAGQTGGAYGNQAQHASGGAAGSGGAATTSTPSAANLNQIVSN